MSNIMRDKEIISDLELLYAESRDMYSNLIRNITAAKKMFLMHQAESNFMSGKFDDFRCYRVAREKRREVNRCFNMQTAGAEEYIMVHRRYDYAAAFQVSCDGYVCGRAFMYDLYAIEDMLLKYYDYVFEFYPDTKRTGGRRRGV